jgi:hypothetical protein
MVRFSLSTAISSPYLLVKSLVSMAVFGSMLLIQSLNF